VNFYTKLIYPYKTAKIVLFLKNPHKNALKIVLVLQNPHRNSQKLPYYCQTHKNRPKNYLILAKSKKIQLKPY
jgi:hypothetical protein